MKKLLDPLFWNRVREDDAYAALRTHIRDIYLNSRYEGDIPELGFKRRIRFEQDGAREEFDAEFFRRRKLLSSAAIMALIYPDEQHYLDELQEIMWAVCGEYSWVLPAHESFSTGDANDFMDLFSSETAFALAEICHVLGERLHQRIRDRVRKEVTWRILRNLDRETMLWEHAENNWASVCGCNVGGAVLYLFPEKFPALLQRLRDVAFRSFFASYSEEGTCLEGLGYWHYGFGTDVWFSELVREYFGGETDLLEGELPRRMAGYGRRCFLRGDVLVNFSESPRRGRLDSGLMACLRHRFPGDVKPIPAWMTEVWPGNTPWLELTRNLIWREHIPADGEFAPESFDLPDSGQVLVAAPGYSLAVRGGSNEIEIAQHCDLGGFIFSTDEGMIFCDPGSGKYSKDYFDPVFRRTHFFTGSQGHSVPLIGGEGQGYGREYCAGITHEENRIRVDLSGAYDLQRQNRITREFLHTDEAVLLTDSFDPNMERITEHFVTLLPPRAENGVIRIGSSVMEYDSALTPVIGSVTAASHTGTETFHTIDFDLPRGTDSVTFTIRP